MTAGKLEIGDLDAVRLEEPDGRGVASSHHLRHNFKTLLTAFSVSDEHQDLLQGHKVGQGQRDVSAGYLTITEEVCESLRPHANRIAERYLKAIPELADVTF